MALIRSLNTAVAGIQAQQFRIEVIGNNIANVDTTAFKSSRVDFATMMSQLVSHGVAPQGNLGGIDPTQIGHGVRVGNTTANFNQGPTEATGVTSDLALQGDGFFVVKDQAGGSLFTRDGSFTLNPSNLLHDPATGFIVQGWMADDNFQINAGGAIGDIEIPIGLEAIARATDVATLSGNLKADGDLAIEGTHRYSDRLYDDRFTNTDLISGENPLGLARATADTPLANVVRSLGNFTSYDETSVGLAGTAQLLFPETASQPSGVEIDLAAFKGARTLPSGKFVIGDPPPTGGTTLGEFTSFLERNFGINTGVWNGAEMTEHTLGFQRHNPQTDEVVDGTIETSLGDSVSLTALTDLDADFRGVEAGDFIRFDSGAAAGQIAEITGISASTLGGPLDTLTFRSDGFNSLSVVPSNLDTYAVHASAGVSLANDVTMLTIDGASPTVTVGAPVTNGAVRSFTITDTALSDFGVDTGIEVDDEIQYLSGGIVVSGRVRSISGDTIDVSFDAVLAQDPDAGTSFDVIDAPPGTIQIAGNVGASNDITNIEMISEGERVSLFDNAPVQSAEGESEVITTLVYDSLGTPRQVQLTFVKEATTTNGPSVWRYFAEASADADLDRIVGSGTVLFGSNGQAIGTGMPDEIINLDLATTSAQAEGVESPFTFELDLSRLTQFATTSSELAYTQDGFEAGTMDDYTVDTDGTVTGIFSNGQVRTIGQISVARFANPNGLTEESSNFYSAAPNSGEPQIGVAGSFGRGIIASGFLEESNVDLAQQFTDLVIGQRAFQANARTISVSDEMLQELVNLI